jgi:hypothetical protein
MNGALESKEKSAGRKARILHRLPCVKQAQSGPIPGISGVAGIVDRNPPPAYLIRVSPALP